MVGIVDGAVQTEVILSGARLDLPQAMSVQPSAKTPSDFDIARQALLQAREAIDAALHALGDKR